MTTVNNAFPYFPEAGTNGYIYIGSANQDAQTNPITVYRDAALTLPWSQPIRTLNGYPAYQGAKAGIYTSATTVSMTVLNSQGGVVTNDTSVSTSNNAANISFIQTGTGAVARDLQTRGREVIYADDYTTLEHALDAAPAGASIYCPPQYAHTLGSTYTISKDVKIFSENWRGVQITGPANSPAFQGVSGVTNFILEGITWIGGAGTSQLLYVPTSGAWFEGKTVLRGNKFNNFGDFAIERGDSTYFTEIRGNRFDNCVGCISEGWASDSVIDDNLFNDLMAGNPVIRLVGGSRTVITSNGFVRASGTITEPDIELNPTTSFGRGGRTFILHNKFGGEGETSGRPKIRTYNATSTNRSTDVVVAFNQMHGMGGTTGTTHCFQFDNPIAGWDVFGNEFDDFDLIVKDSVGKFDGILGLNKWGRNRYFWSERLNGKLFENGGRMFSELDENVYGYQPVRTMYEPREARNRLWNSTAIGSWNKSAGVTITSGQTDPDGGTNAFLIESDGTAAAQNVFRSIDITGMGSTVIVKLRLKAGASTKIIVGLRDSAAPSGWVGMIQNLVIDSQWRDYVFQLTVVNPANAHQLYIYPADTVASRAGGFYIYQPQVSDFESDFLPTSGGAGASDTTIGRRFGKKVSLAGGAKATLPTYADNAAALAGGLLATDLYKTAAGEVRVVV